MLLPIMGIAQAGADYAPQPNDIVGVGGDTPQFAVDFGLNGDTAGAAGFNSTATVNRVVDFDATADGNARTAYTQGSSEKTPSLLNPTDVLRAGTSPVQRISSSGNAITALLADTRVPGDDQLHLQRQPSDRRAAEHGRHRGLRLPPRRRDRHRRSADRRRQRHRRQHHLHHERPGRAVGNQLLCIYD